MNYKSTLSWSAIFWLVTITLLVIGAIIYYIPTEDRSLLNIVGIISAILSLTGFYITIRQIQSVKEIAEQTDLAIKDKLANYNKTIFLADISNKISLVNELKTYLRVQDFKTCIIRMEDFKRTLASLSPNSDLLNLVIDEKKLNEVKRDFRIGMGTIEKRLQNEDYKIDIDKMISNMDSLSTYLLNIEVQLKQNNL